MTEKTRGQRVVWGALLWAWFIIGVAAGVAVQEFANGLPWSVAVPAVAVWGLVFIPLWGKAFTD